MDYQNIFLEIPKELEQIADKGNVASYIPELSNINPDKFGIHLTTIDNRNYSLGDSDEKFSIQSISKVLSLCLAFKLEKDELWSRVGVEPSGSPFNSLVQLEYEKGIPRNPFINAGALVICDVLVSRLSHPKRDFLEFLRRISGIENISYSPRVAASEKSTGYRNLALISLMKEFGNIENNIETVLDLYFNLCSIEMSCKELSKTFLFLADYGVHPLTKERVVSVSKSKRINAIMQLCGFYDEAGEFSFKVGLPGKSGVGGGIVAIHPGQYSIAVWSPKLNEKGNSYKGMKILEFLTTRTRSSIF
ncbi:putative glutaminase [Desulfamplus magnetovallimortis]|uniref:Glutaminase n=1 Tax=Desulfamplus magnetovallimortis TaxID=1246637 RepID=A0A1W1HIZ3_9BACT|nr:glutaminase [Desulfamplus magnetovallimortis]SLM32413.1 putative glutaminase [Desulfamplus magnetovallimortis]